jgi:hypothetical protein
MLVHLDVESIGVDATAEKPASEKRHIRFELLSQDGTIAKYATIHVKEGALTEGNGFITFPGSR